MWVGMLLIRHKRAEVSQIYTRMMRKDLVQIDCSGENHERDKRIGRNCGMED